MQPTTRLDANTVRINAGTRFDITLFANEEVPVDRKSIAEIQEFARIEETLDRLNARRFFGDHTAAIRRISLSPDFHRGAGIPVGSAIDAQGFVIPKCTGNDIGCGMRLTVLDGLDESAVRDAGSRLDQTLRHIFFEGGRDIVMTPALREGILREGAYALDGRLPGGLWDWFDAAQHERDLARHHHDGSWPTDGVFGLSDFIQGSGGASRDMQSGSIGGGNHFCELQVVEEILDKPTAWRWGLKPGSVTVMAHTGSVAIGHLVGGHFGDLARSLHPADLPKPVAGFHPLPVDGALGHHGRAYLSAMGNGANFAVVNRLLLTLMAQRALAEATGRALAARLVYDAPHNLIWSNGADHLHRKGTTPAGADMADAEFPDGHPVIVPGSMGASSYLLKGCGNPACLCSAPHGAGRVQARGEGRKGNASEIDALRVVTKADITRLRRDVAEERIKDLLEEAPSVYKDIGPVVRTVSDAGVATPVARMRPLLTIKG